MKRPRRSMINYWMNRGCLGESIVLTSSWMSTNKHYVVNQRNYKTESVRNNKDSGLTRLVAGALNAAILTIQNRCQVARRCMVSLRRQCSIASARIKCLSVKAFIWDITFYKLEKAGVLQLINVAPTTMVTLQSLIEKMRRQIWGNTKKTYTWDCGHLSQRRQWRYLKHKWKILIIVSLCIIDWKLGWQFI